MKLKLDKKNLGWLFLGLGLMLILQISVWYVKSGKKFDVNYIPATSIEGYAGRPAEVRVSASRNIKWDEASGLLKTVGRIFWLGIIVMAWYVGTDRNEKKAANTPGGTKNGAKQVGLLFAPVLLCMICWFAGYSSSLNEGELVKPYDQFISEYKISNDQSNLIKQSKSIKDENGLITAYFKNK